MKQALVTVQTWPVVQVYEMWLLLGHQTRTKTDRGPTQFRNRIIVFTTVRINTTALCNHAVPQKSGTIM